MKHLVELNIGIDINKQDTDQIIEGIHNHPFCDDFKLGYITGSSLSLEDNVIYVRFWTKLSRFSTIIAWIENILTQHDREVAAVKIDGDGILVYNYTKEVTRETFNSTLFRK